MVDPSTTEKATATRHDDAQRLAVPQGDDVGGGCHSETGQVGMAGLALALHCQRVPSAKAGGFFVAKSQLLVASNKYPLS